MPRVRFTKRGEVDVNGWSYDPDFRAYARRDERGDPSVMAHHNASAETILGSRAESLLVIEVLRESNGTEIVGGKDVTVTIVVNNSREIGDRIREVERLDYELDCHDALERSEFELGDPVVVGPRWTTGPVEGDGGRYVHDNGTGQRGKVLAVSPDGLDIKIADPGVGYDWVHVTRLEREK